VEWVEVAGKTVDEATEQALDQLGVGPGDAEIIVVNEPKMGLFGRVRVEARVRARVRPVGARPKRERSRRGGTNSRSGQGTRQGGGERNGERSSSSGSRSGGGGGGRGANGGGRSSATTTAPSSAEAGTSGGGDAGERNGSQSGRNNENGPAGTGTGTSRSARRRRNRSKATAGGAGATGEGTRDRSRNGSTGEPSGSRAPQRSNESKEPKETVDMAEGMTLEEQGEIGRAFVVGLLAEYGLDATVETRMVDEDTVEIAASGDDLGTLVGPRGSTLAALQDLTRAVVQRQCPSRTDRILVDVAGYRERRSAALKRFSVQIAEEVISSGQEKALEAMSPADRKSVHDAITEMDGVVTRSEGEDPNRYIVIAPAS
jgi:spoIIIJ-associated protein